MQRLLDEFEQGEADAEQMSFEQFLTADPAIQPETQSPSPARSLPAPVTGRHQDVRLYLTMLLKTYAETIDAGLVRDMPYDVRLNENMIYQPDIVFVSNSSFDRVHDAYLEGPPDLIVEVLTPESTALDRGEKFVAYEAYGVREYWQIDPVREMVELYHLGPADRYKVYRPDIAGRLRSRVLKGFSLDVDRLWQRVLPRTTDILEMVQEMVAQR